MKKCSAFMVITAGILWGSMGIFVRWFDGIGFSSVQTATMRIVTCAVSLFIISYVTCGKEVFRIDLRDTGWFLLSGVVSVFGMSWLYFEAINRSSMCMSAILLYTAPFIVTVLSCIFFKEKFTIKKLVALVIAFTGCVFVTGTDGNVTVAGVLFGLASGLAYALYSVFAKILMKKYAPMTVTVYSFGFAAVVYLFAGNIPDMANIISDSGVPFLTLVIALAMGLVTATAPFLLYTFGLKGMDAGKASIMAYTEPLVAAVCGYLVFGEFSGGIAVVGIAFITFAVLLINNFGRNQNE